MTPRLPCSVRRPRTGATVLLAAAMTARCAPANRLADATVDHPGPTTDTPRPDVALAPDATALDAPDALDALVPDATVPDASTPQPTLADLVERNAAFLKFDKAHPRLGAPMSMHYLSTVWRGDTLYAYYITAGTHGPAIGLATSTDGYDFTQVDRVLDTGAGCAWDSTMASFPGVFYDAGTFYLTYEGHNQGGRCPGGAVSDGWIGLATSTDGVHFTRNPAPLMTNLPRGWESANVGTPSLFRANGQWYLFYHAYDGHACRIGVATGASLASLTRYAGNPILDVIPHTWQSGTAGHRDVMAVDGAYYMAYEGSTDQPYDTAHWSSGFARSSDLLHWTLFAQNNTLPDTAGFGHDGPTFADVDDVTWVYYRIGGSVGNITGRARVADETHGGFDASWEAVTLPHQVGFADGDGWAVDVRSQASYLQFGPYATTVPVGDNDAVWKLMIDNNTADDHPVVRLEVSDAESQTVIARHDVTRHAFRSTMNYQYFTLPFTLPASAAGHRIEFRVWWYGIAYIREQRVGLS